MVTLQSFYFYVVSFYITVTFELTVNCCHLYPSTGTGLCDPQVSVILANDGDISVACGTSGCPSF